MRHDLKFMLFGGEESLLNSHIVTSIKYRKLGYALTGIVQLITDASQTHLLRLATVSKNSRKSRWVRLAQLDIVFINENGKGSGH